MKKIFIYTCLFLVSACASLSNPGLKPRTVEDYYVSTGVEKYFLADIPGWANFNQRADCYHNTNIRYFDIDALMKSYGFTYNMALQVQATFNEESWSFKKADKKQITTLKEEELLFYKVTEKVTNKIIFFDPPTFGRINMIWLDEVLGNPNSEKKLKSLLSSSTMDTGVPVLVSFCLTRPEVEELYPDFNTKMITAELFSVYDNKGTKSPGFKIILDQFFKTNQKLYFYSQKKTDLTDEVIGNYKLENY